MVFRLLSSFANNTVPVFADLTDDSTADWGFFDDIILVHQNRLTSILNI